MHVASGINKSIWIWYDNFRICILWFSMELSTIKTNKQNYSIKFSQKKDKKQKQKTNKFKKYTLNPIVMYFLDSTEYVVNTVHSLIFLKIMHNWKILNWVIDIIVSSMKKDESVSLKYTNQIFHQKRFFFFALNQQKIFWINKPVSLFSVRHINPNSTITIQISTK